jgi:hypothetical protein
MSPPCRPALLASHDRYPSSAAAAQPLGVSYAASSSCCCPAADRAWQVLTRCATDAVREVQVVPIRTVLEREPGGAVYAPAGACWTVAADEGRGVEIAFEAGGLLAWVEQVAW